MIRETISRKQAAASLSVSTRTIDRWLRDKRIHGFIPFNSKRILIYKDSLTQENLQSPIPKFKNEI
jgi:predicted site-specific integrase-resolvase